MRSAQMFTETFFRTENHPGNLKCYPQACPKNLISSSDTPYLTCRLSLQCMTRSSTVFFNSGYNTTGSCCMSKTIPLRPDFVSDNIQTAVRT